MSTMNGKLVWNTLWNGVWQAVLCILAIAGFLAAISGLGYLEARFLPEAAFWVNVVLLILAAVGLAIAAAVESTADKTYGKIATSSGEKRSQGDEEKGWRKVASTIGSAAILTGAGVIMIACSYGIWMEPHHLP